jgi:hypothetical protein
LQTPDYARELMEADVSVRPAEIEKLIVARLRRQQFEHRVDVGGRFESEASATRPAESGGGHSGSISGACR